jgi:mono/diheme cytochrome c family protein
MWVGEATAGREQTTIWPFCARHDSVCSARHQNRLGAATRDSVIGLSRPPARPTGNGDVEFEMRTHNHVMAVLFVSLIAIAVDAANAKKPADRGDADAGHDLALDACTGCHVVSDPTASESTASVNVATMIGTTTISDIVTTMTGDIDAETAVAR